MAATATGVSVGNIMMTTDSGDEDECLDAAHKLLNTICREKCLGLYGQQLTHTHPSYTLHGKSD